MNISLFKNCAWLEQFHLSIELFKWYTFNEKYCQKINMKMIWNVIFKQL